MTRAWGALLAVAAVCAACSGPPEAERLNSVAPSRAAPKRSAKLSVPAALVHPLVDLEPGTQVVSSNPANLTLVGDRLYFTAETPISGRQLWTSDGTFDGTQMVAYLAQNAGDGEPQFQSLTSFQGSLFFIGPSAGFFRTNGDVASTQLLNPSFSFSPLGSMQVMGEALYLSASDFDHGGELWKTDGTMAGTVLVRDIVPNQGSSSPANLTVAGNTLFFIADDGTGLGPTLFKSDGTDAGTLRVDGTFERVTYPSSLTALGPLVFFAANDPGGLEPWWSDGTSAATYKFADLARGASSSSPRQFTAAGPWMYFQADTDIAYDSLVRTNGLDTLILAGPTPRHLVALDGKLLFDSLTPSYLGEDLWVSDGTDAGTYRVTTLTATDNGGGLNSAVSFQHQLFFANNTDTTGPELWVSDGTATGTHVLLDAIPGPGGIAPTNLVAGDEQLYFAAGDLSTTGNELWTSDGTPGGTKLLADIATAGNPSNPSTPVQLGGALYFAADHTDAGRKVWQVQLSDAGAQLLSDLGQGDVDLQPLQLTVSNALLFFTATGGVNGLQLWASDGTSAGTRTVHDFGPNANYFGPIEMAPWNGGLLFAGYDAAHGVELWYTDGTVAGTNLVSDLDPGTASGSPYGLTVMGDATYFFAFTGTETAFFRTDGTSAGTMQLLAISQYDSVPTTWRPVVMDGTLYFMSGTALWRSDGTAVGTIPTTTEGLSTDEGVNPELTACNHQLYFKSDLNAQDGIELWTSDGTVGGAHEVADLTPGLGSSDIGSFTPLGNRVVFERRTLLPGGTNTQDTLWITDGTANGTVQLEVLQFRKQEVGGEERFLPMLAIIPEGRVAFLASGTWQGEEPWVTDGTTLGTRPLVEIGPGPASSNPGLPARFGNSVILPADDGRIGSELWSIDLSVVTDDVPPTLTCPANVAEVTASSSGAAVSYPPPTASDAVTGVSVTSTPASGASFPVGTTTVNVVASDAFGNQSHCSFEVTLTLQVPSPDAGPPAQVASKGNGGCSTAAGVSPEVLIGLFGLLFALAGPRRRMSR